MNAVTNNDGTIDLKGLTKLQAFGLLALVGSINGGTGITTPIWNILLPLFPKYADNSGSYNKYELLKGNGEQNYISYNALNVNKLFDELYPKKSIASSGLTNQQRRDSKGRFEKKVWVARFDYPDSRNRLDTIARTVITQITARQKPALHFYEDSIEGVDLVRGAFRKFVWGRVEGDVTWTKEYASDVKHVY